MLTRALLVFVGGGIGSLFRWITGLAAKKAFPEVLFPLGTLLSNTISCILFAAVFLWFGPKLKQPDMPHLLFITGICGGYSTFSTFSFETFRLIKEQHYVLAIANILINLAVCLLVFSVVLKKMNW